MLRRMCTLIMGTISQVMMSLTPPLLDLYIQDYGNNSVVNVMTPFTFREFENLWDLVCVAFISGMTNGKGPNSTTKPKDIFFILLLVLKSPSGWDKVSSTLE